MLQSLIFWLRMELRQMYQSIFVGYDRLGVRCTFLKLPLPIVENKRIMCITNHFFRCTQQALSAR
jgi:hypothetical protein